MRNVFACCLVLVFASASVAQITAPVGFLSKSGNRYAYNQALAFAGSDFSQAQVQIADRDIVQPIVLKRLDYRTQSFATYSPHSGQGRTFSVVVLKLGHAAPVMTSTFSLNWNGAETTVFAAAGWSQNARTSGKPKQVWGNAGSFPFSKAMVYVPKKGALLQDWTTLGGKLANGYALSSAYHVDGEFALPPNSQTYVLPGSSSTAASRYLPRYPHGLNNACNDSSMPATSSDALAYLDLFVYGDHHSTASLQGMGQIATSYSFRTAPGGKMIGMLSVGGNDAGVAIGAMCNRVHVNPLTHLAVVAKTASTGATAYTANWFPTAPFAWSDAWEGQRAYWQVAYEDSKTKALRLTNATRLALPRKPSIYVTGVAAYVYGYTFLDKKYGPFGPFQSSYQNPIERWSQK